MIYVTGDTHGSKQLGEHSVDGFMHRLCSEKFADSEKMTKNDYVIILGDFGGVWAQAETEEECAALDWLEARNFTTLFIDGNHDNHDRLQNDYPLKAWNGGFVHELRPSVLHLVRGNVFDIDGCSFFAFGGAASHDIKDGILDPSQFSTSEELNEVYNQWMQEGRVFRIKGYEWWEQELPSEAEMEAGRIALAQHNNQVDFLLTHSPAYSQLAAFTGGEYKKDILMEYLDEIKASVDYKIHFFAHMHANGKVDSNSICLYNQMIRIK